MSDKQDVILTIEQIIAHDKRHHKKMITRAIIGFIIGSTITTIAIQLVSLLPGA